MVTNSDIKYVRDLGSAINTNGGDDVHIIGNGLNFNPASIENIDEFNAENDKPIFKMSRGGEIFHNYEENGNFPWRESARRIFEDPYFFSSETMWRPTTLRDRNNPISNPNRSRIDVDLEHASEEEVSEWALELVAQISNNLVYGGIHLANFNKLSDRSKLDLYRLINMYNDPEGKTGVANLYYENEDGSTDIAWDGIGRAFKGIMSDPTTYGGGLIYKIGAKTLAGLTGKLTSKGATLKAMQVLLSPTMLASVEGGIYSSSFDYQQQKFEIEGRNLNPLQYPDGRIPNEVQRNLDPTRLGSAYLLGAVFGPAIEGLFKAPQAYRAIKKQIDDYRQKNNIPETKEIKNMVMLHNTGEEAIINYQELGGIPSPSLAVTKADQRFEGFGSIQLIARPERFDPSTDPKNVIYGADAYTPRMPRGENKFLDNAEDLIEAEYRPLMDKYGVNEGIDPAYNFRDFERPTTLTRIKFLDELGYEKEIKEALDVDVDKIRQKMIEEYELAIANPDTRPDLVPHFKTLLEETKKGLKDINPSLRKEKNIRELFDSVVGQFIKEDAFDSFLNAERKKYTDPNKTFSAINKKVQRRIDEIVERLNDPDVQRNNDLYESLTLELEYLDFTKKWEDVPYTLENILDNMVEEVQRGGEKGFGSGGPNKVRAVASKSYKDLDEVRRDKGRIMHQDDVDAIKANKTTAEDGSFIGQESDLEYNWDRLQRHVDRFSEGGVEQDSLYYAMIDAIRSDQSDEAIKEAFQYIGGEQYGPDMIQRVRNMIGILREVDVPYFEAKPQRVVDLSEFGGAIVPDNTDPKVIKILEDHGIEIQYIDESMEGNFSGDGTLTVEAKARKDFFKKFFFTVPPAVMATDAVLDENNRQAE